MATNAHELDYKDTKRKREKRINLPLFSNKELFQVVP